MVSYVQVWGPSLWYEHYGFSDYDAVELCTFVRNVPVNQATRRHMRVTAIIEFV
jgi:hypothetical protein